VLSVAEECDGFAIWAAMCAIYELAVRAATRVIDAKGADVQTMLWTLAAILLAKVYVVR
jgi:hypothetical protein